MAITATTAAASPWHDKALLPGIGFGLVCALLLLGSPGTLGHLHGAEATVQVNIVTPAVVDFAKDVVAASKTHPVLVDFNAVWCGPCRMLSPVLERSVAARPGLTLVSIDIDANGAIAQAQGVDGIPDVRLWKDGAEVARFIGFRSEAEVTAWLDQALAKQ